MFLIMGATDKRTPQGFGLLAMGLGLTLMHLISNPVSNPLWGDCGSRARRTDFAP